MNQCYLCGSTDFTMRKGLVRDLPEVKIQECDECGLVSLDSTAQIYPGFYENSGMHGGTPQPIEDWLKETSVDDQRRFEQFKPLLVNKSILDFGCGAGGFLLNAGSVADHTTGIELETRVRDYWNGSAISITSSIDEAANLPIVDSLGYDVVTAFHVVEHLPDPLDILMKLGAVMKPDGRMIIEVPSADDILLTLYDCDAFQRFTYWSQHLYLFTASTLASLVKKAGLKIVSIQHYQRYPLSNHLHWLSKGKPGGHQVWSFLDNSTINYSYANMLASIGKTDTLIAHIEK